MHFCVTTTVNIMVAHHIPHHYSDHYYYYYYITLYYIIGQANMADHMRRHRVRWLGHAARKPNDVMVKQLLFAHTIPGHHRPMIDLPRDWANPGRVEGGGQPVLSFEQCIIFA